VRQAVISIGICLFASHAVAQSRVDEAIRLSKLTLSAMECANLAPSEADFQRLFEVGLSSGKKFLDLLSKLSPEESKTASPNLAMLWRGVSGPSTDFVLGRVFEQMTTIAYKSLGEDTSKWDRDKSVRYSVKNCMLIR
jgi:hypothetical protein